MRRLSSLVATDPSFRTSLVDDSRSAGRARGIELSPTEDAELAAGLDLLRRQRAILAPEDIDGKLDGLDTFTRLRDGGRRGRRPRVALVVMPFASVRYPVIGVSILQGALEEVGIASTVLYPNLDFARLVGIPTYDAVGVESPPAALAGEWAFRSPAATTAERDRRYVEDILLGRFSTYFGFPEIFRLGVVRTLADRFLARLAVDDVWGDFDVIGFTSMFQQNVASLRLATLLRSHHPDVPIVFGGTNCEGPMGEVIAERFPAVTCVFQGEADVELPGLVERVATMRTDPGTAQVIRCAPVDDMHRVPVPRYGDFFGRMSFTASQGVVGLPFEMSRGCWWGEKQHCTFCGLNGTTMRFRSKAPERVLDELGYLTTKWGGDGPVWVMVVDNILDYRYFDSLLPKLVDGPMEVQLHFEVKSNLRLDQLQLLAAAGVTHLQPGIESMSNRVLKLMRKGTTRLRNLQTLKWCKEVGIPVAWNYLHGFPGETDRDYEDLPDLFRLVEHLDPPGWVGRARADRFSPFFLEPTHLGARGIRREPAYAFVYPTLPEADLDRIAYHFELVADDLASDRAIAGLTTAADGWRQRHRTATLRGAWMDGCLRVTDSRQHGATPSGRETTLSPTASRVALAIDQAATAPTVIKRLGPDPGAIDVRAELDRLVERGLAVADGDAYLGLVVLDRATLPAGMDPDRRPRRRLPVAASDVTAGGARASQGHRRATER